jgi:phosphatidylglycerol---prolipoprotein diacylglyceryl transferase
VGTPLGVHLHPTQLIEAVVEVGNFVLLSWLIRRKTFDGQVFGSYMVLYGIARFFVEFLRGDPGRGEVFGGLMTGTQLISILLVIGGGLMWLRRQPLAVPAVAAR